jgi:hypothetical protein
MFAIPRYKIGLLHAAQENDIGGMDFSATAALAGLAVNPMAGGQATLSIESCASPNMLGTELREPIPDDNCMPVIHLNGIPIGAILGKVRVDGNVGDETAVSGL